MSEKSINEISKSAKDAYDKGRVALERNSFDNAFHFLKQCLAFEPGFLPARQLLRGAQIKKFGSGGKISKIFGSITGSTDLAKAMMNAKKDPIKSMEAAEEALESNPFNMQALKVLASAAEAQGLLNTAIHSYEIAKEHDPKNVEALMEMGRLYLLIQQPAKARACYELVLEIDPSKSEAFKGMKDSTAHEAMNKGNWEGSYRDNMKDAKEAKELEQGRQIFKDEDVIHAQIAVFNKNVEEQPENVSHWKKLGDLWLQINSFDHANYCYEVAFNLTKGADITIEKLMMDTKVKKLSHEMKEKEAKLAADPNNEALKQEVEALKQQREAMILQDCESRSQRYPNDLEIKYELARIYFRHQLIDKAIPEFQTAANNPKNKIACTNWLGRCFCEKGMLDMAVEKFQTAAQQALAMDGLKKEILYNLGIAYEKLNKEAEAIEQFKLIYASDVNYKDVGKKIEAFYKKKSATA